MKITEGPLAGLLIIEPKVFSDPRGHFFESYKKAAFAELGVPSFVQDNISHSKQNVIRGLHYQLPNAQGKLVWVTYGSVWDVVVDIRRSSPTFGRWFNIVLTQDNYTQLYIPPGFAHGFCVLSPAADFYYKCTEYYSPSTERGILWNDKRLNIPWPTEYPLLSSKDEILPCFDEIENNALFA